MTAREAEKRLVDKYPSYLKETGELSEIVQFLDQFTDEDISKIWEAFRMSYAFASAPRLAVFNKASQEVGARFKSGTQKAYEFVCYICGARFSLTQTTCPNCGNRDKAWRSVIVAGGYRVGRLKKEIEDEREEVYKARMGL